MDCGALHLPRSPGYAPQADRQPVSEGCLIAVHSICADHMSGVYVASSPKPVSQVEFMRTLKQVIGLPAIAWLGGCIPSHQNLGLSMMSRG